MSQDDTNSRGSTIEERKTRSTLMEHNPNENKEARKAKDAGKTFKRLFGYTWKNKSMLIIANISLVISSGCMVLLPLLCGQMVDTIR